MRWIALFVLLASPQDSSRITLEQTAPFRALAEELSKKSGEKVPVDSGVEDKTLELRVRDAEGELARLLFEDVLGERATHRLRRALPEDAREEHRKVADVNAVFMAKMDRELRPREARPREARPGPMILPIHHREEASLERAAFVRLHDHADLPL